MPAISNLPPLKVATDSIEPPDSSGIWVPRTGTSILRKIADSLDYKDEVVEDAPSTPHRNGKSTASVPDVWAQVSVFQTDLFYDGNEPLKLQSKIKAIAEWRGLIALLALKNRFGYSVLSLPLDFRITGTVGTEGMSAAESTAEDSFLAVCGRLLPKAVAFAHHDWKSISVLQVERSTVGIFVPTTLIAPARDYHIRLAGSAHIPWFVEYALQDPTARSSGLRPREILLLSAFVGGLLESVRSTPAADDQMKNALIGLLVRYLQDCNAITVAEGLDDGMVQQTGSLGLDLPVSQKVYNAFNNVFDTTGGLEHQTRLRPTSNASKYFKGVVLYDSKNEFRQLGASTESLVVWGDLTHARVTKDPAALERAKVDARKNGYILCDVAELFTSKLVPLRSGRAPRHGTSLDRFLLPFSPLVLLLLEGENLLRSVRIERTPNEDLRVSLTIELVNERDQRHAIYVAERIYRRDLDEIEERDVPLATSVWPDFKSDHWRFYTAFYRGSPIRDLGITGIVSLTGLFTSIPAEATPENVVARIISWSRGEGVAAKEVSIVRSTEIVSHLYISTAPIEALACGLVSQGGRANQTLGFILTPALKNAPSTTATQRGTIGVDFGTSNTCVYLKSGPFQMPLEATIDNMQILPLVQLAGDGSAKTDPMAFSDFMPLKVAEMPFLSLLRTRELPGQLANLPFGADHIWFVNDLKDSMEKAVSNDPHLHFNLKWSKAADDRQRLQSFLRQVALLGLAKATATGIEPSNVEWAFSYPLTKNFNEQEYRGTCQRSVDEALEAVTGVQKRAVLIEEITESEAAALYFRARGDAFSGTTITIDIGGGTTDISVWDATTQIWRYSFELAGRKILLSFLRRRMSFFQKLCEGADNATDLHDINELFGTKEFRKALSKTPRSGENNDAADPIVKMLEIIINNPSFKNQLANRLGILSGETDGATLKWHVTIALAGMMYYVGRQVAAMSDRLKIDAREGVKVLLSGRGSSIYTSLFSNPLELQQRLQTVFVNAAGLPEDMPFSVVYSPQPKHEAAFGLVADWGLEKDNQKLILNGPRRLNSLVIGEALETSNKEVLDASTLANQVIDVRDLKVASLAEMNKFLRLMEGLTAKTRAGDRPDGVRLNIPKAKEADLIRNINQFLANWAASAEPGSTSIREPVFLVALRSIIDLVNDGDLKLTPVE